MAISSSKLKKPFYKINAVKALILIVSMIMVLTSVSAALPQNSSQASSASPAMYTYSPFYNTTSNFTGGQANPSAPVSSLIVLKAPGLSSYVNDMGDFSSPDYRSYLSSQAIASQFGSPVYTQIATYLQSRGLTVQTFSNNLILYVTGTVSQFDSAFHTRIVTAEVNGTQEDFNTLPLSLPAGISPYVTGMTGFSDQTVSPQLYRVSGISLSNAANAAGTYEALDQALYYKDGNYLWTTFPSPENQYQFLFPGTMPALTGAYELWDGQDTIASQPDMGQGITIAVTEVGFISPETIMNFSEYVFHNPYQVLDRLTQIGVDIPSFQAGIQDAHEWGWTGETALDIEYIAAMDPDAHIDLVAVPNDRLAAFDLAYAYIGQYLDTGQVENLAGTPVHIFSGPADQAAFSISITSNSHSFYSTEVSYFAAPFDVLVQEELVNILAVHGVTQFFATGDSGSNNGGTVLQASRPVEAAGAVAVGGGQVTAEDNGNEFPVTGIVTTVDGTMMNVATATGIGSYTYWSASGGQTGGTYAQSTIVQRPWWENALDTYSTTGIIEPVVSNAASFNMTLYDHGWQLFYGGTSFATPITAAEFGLIEEQVAYAGLSPMLGNANPVFFEAHNVYEQGLSSLNPYYPMQNIGVGWTWAPFNSYDWNYLNTTEEYPQYQNLPSWYSTIFNPAGDGWTFLGGLGMPLVNVLDSMIVGTYAGSNSLMNQPYYILVNSSGIPVPFTSLTGSVPYSFTVLTSNGDPAGYLTIYAYSGDAGNGTYGGGTVTVIRTDNGRFNYTPEYAAQPVPENASEYAYFIIVPQGRSITSGIWSFVQYGVNPPAAKGNLTLEVPTEMGLQTSVAEEQMFEDFNVQDTYNFGSLGIVTLNGDPVSGAVVIQKSVYVTYDLENDDIAVNASQFATGQTIGHWITDAAGQFYFWNNPLVSANNGPVPAQIFTLYAEFNGKISNTVTVYVEPQAGQFQPYLKYNPATNTVQGNVFFYGMKYIESLNVSTGPAPGQYETETFTPNTTANGYIPVNISAPSSWPINVTMFATGENTISEPYSFYLISTPLVSVGNPIEWLYRISIPVNLSSSGSSGSGLMVSVASSIVSSNLTFITNYAGRNGNIIYTFTGPSSLSGDMTIYGINSSINVSSLDNGYYLLNATVIINGVPDYSFSQAILIDHPLSNLLNEMKNMTYQLSTLKVELKTIDSSSTIGLAEYTAIHKQIEVTSGTLSDAMHYYNESINISKNSEIAAFTDFNALSLNNNPGNITAYFASMHNELKAGGIELENYSTLLNSAYHNSTPGFPYTFTYMIISAIIIAGIVMGIFFERKNKKSGKP